METCDTRNNCINQARVARSMVSTNRWLRGIKTYRFPWYLTLVSASHALSNPGQEVRTNHQMRTSWTPHLNYILNCCIVSFNYLHEILGSI